MTTVPCRSDDFCLIHGYDHMQSRMGDPIPFCQACEDEKDCTCRMSSVNTASIDPPEMVLNPRCPVHGKYRDPDEEYERRRDDAAFDRQMGWDKDANDDY
jgi:hypothetical protein